MPAPAAATVPCTKRRRVTPPCRRPSPAPLRPHAPRARSNKLSNVRNMQLSSSSSCFAAITHEPRPGPHRGRSRAGRHTRSYADRTCCREESASHARPAGPPRDCLEVSIATSGELDPLDRLTRIVELYVNVLGAHAPRREVNRDHATLFLSHSSRTRRQHRIPRIDYPRDALDKSWGCRCTISSISTRYFTRNAGI